MHSPSHENLLPFPAVTRCGLLPDLLSIILEFSEQPGAGAIKELVPQVL